MAAVAGRATLAFWPADVLAGVVATLAERLATSVSGDFDVAHDMFVARMATSQARDINPAVLAIGRVDHGLTLPGETHLLD
ncbi:MAG: hypothetical protein EPO65_02650 [Dehalococcoidia bacterium]|nr:MAG: hypothetical protein EPO65_02650 [Dehalococcoidia bacterium]